MVGLIKKWMGLIAHISSLGMFIQCCSKILFQWLLQWEDRCSGLAFFPFDFSSGHHTNIKRQTRLNSTPSLTSFVIYEFSLQPCNLRKRRSLKCVLNFNIFSYWPLSLSSHHLCSWPNLLTRKQNTLLWNSQKQREKLSF